MSHCVVSGKDITVSTYTYLQAVSAVPRKQGYYLWDGGFMRMIRWAVVQLPEGVGFSILNALTDFLVTGRGILHIADQVHVSVTLPTKKTAYHTIVAF